MTVKVKPNHPTARGILSQLSCIQLMGRVSVYNTKKSKKAG